MGLNTKKYLKTWVEISEKALLNNLSIFKKLSKGQKFMAVIKSNAYGHGMLKIAKLIQNKVDYFGVDSVREGLELRKEKIKTPILVLGPTIPTQIAFAIRNNLEISISSLDQLQNVLFLKNKQILRIHIKVDTGMGRQGFLFWEDKKLIEVLKNLPKHIKLVGLYGHLASGDTKRGERQTKKQITEYKEWVSLFKKNKFNLTTHLCATSGVLNHQDGEFDMVRVGIGLYGIWPSNYLKNKLSDKFKLEPVLKWKTVLTEIKILEKGSCVGYGCLEKLSKTLKIGICPVGYWHGFPRNFSTRAYVLINNQKAKVLGAVSMDMIAVDLSMIKNPKPMDEVLIMGGGVQQITNFNNLEEKLGQSAYELSTRINPLIYRL